MTHWHTVRFVDKEIKPHWGGGSQEVWSAMKGKAVQISTRFTRQELLARGYEPGPDCECEEFFWARSEAAPWSLKGFYVACRRILEMD